MASSSKVDPKEVFLQAVFFDYACRVLWMDTSMALNTMLPPPGAAIPSPASGVGVVVAATSADLPPALFPAIVNSALSIELYLKALLLHETGDKPQVHKLSELFLKLPPPFQSQIEKLYTEAFDASPDLVHARNAAVDKSQYELLNTLTKYNSMFVDMRYSYELPHIDGSLLSPVRLALLQTILVTKPEWSSLTTCLDKPPAYLIPWLPTPTV